VTGSDAIRFDIARTGRFQLLTHPLKAGCRRVIMSRTRRANGGSKTANKSRNRERHRLQDQEAPLESGEGFTEENCAVCLKKSDKLDWQGTCPRCVKAEEASEP
jgi:hypothetical protein